MQRIAFVRNGVVVSVAMGRREDADAMAAACGYDGWTELTTAPTDVLREVEVGDTISASKRASQAFELNPATAHVTRYGIKFVTAGVRDYAKLAQAQALAPQPAIASQSAEAE